MPVALDRKVKLSSSSYEAIDTLKLGHGEFRLSTHTQSLSVEIAEWKRELELHREERERESESERSKFISQCRMRMRLNKLIKSKYLSFSGIFGMSIDILYYTVKSETETSVYFVWQFFLRWKKNFKIRFMFRISCLPFLYWGNYLFFWFLLVSFLFLIIRERKRNFKYNYLKFKGRKRDMGWRESKKSEERHTKE